MEPRIYSVYDRDGRLVLGVTDEPGEMGLTRPPEDDSEIIEISWATLQCYRLEAEPELLKLVVRAPDLPSFLDKLKSLRYRVVEGRPRPMTFARL